MQALLWINQNWNEVVLTGGAIVGALAHIRALIPLPRVIGNAIDWVVGNYGRATNALKN